MRYPLTGLSGVEGDPYEATLRVIWDSNDPFYTVEQAQQRYALDPVIRDDLWAILGSTDYREWWPPTAHMFRYVGRKQDVAKIEVYLRSLEGNLGRHGDKALKRIMLSVAEMARRGVPGAMELSRRFTTPGFWAECRFDVLAKRSPSYPSFEEEMALAGLGTHAYALDADFEDAIERTTRALDPTPDARWRIDSEVTYARRAFAHWQNEVKTGNLGAGRPLGDPPRAPPWWALREARVAASIAGGAAVLSVLGSAGATRWMRRRHNRPGPSGP